jgi:hypothetical protein
VEMLTVLLLLAIWLLVSLIIVFPLAKMMHVGSAGSADADKLNEAPKGAKGTQRGTRNSPASDFPALTGRRASH